MTSSSSPNPSPPTASSPPLSSVVLTAEQQGAVDQICDWLANEPQHNTFTLGGYAGTGKSTVISHFIRLRTSGLAVATLAGKAASVLRRKGVRQAQTLHSLIYEVRDNGFGKMIFVRRPFLTLETECGHQPVEMVIVDEASMINTKLYTDLVRYGLPVLFVGDHGQLEPIGDNPGLMMSPRHRLETIHRQVAGNLILRLATAFRENREAEVWAAMDRGWVCETGELQFGFRNEWKKFLKPDVQVICGFNQTRHRINYHVRLGRGAKGPLPEPGDLLICLKNNATYQVFNGQQATVLEVFDNNTYATNLKLKIEDGREIVLPAINDQFGKDPITELFQDKENCFYDYGYCVTAHKAQGSEWDEVLVIEELADGWTPSRWRYTVATRAKRRLTYLR